MSRDCAAAIVLGLAILLGPNGIEGQVQTNKPDVVPGARPATVERIKIHGAALEGNLEGRQVLAKLTNIIGQMQRAEVRRTRLGLTG